MKENKENNILNLKDDEKKILEQKLFNQKWVDIFTWCNRKSIETKRGNKVINYAKWFAIIILSILDNFKNMKNDELLKWVEKLAEMSLREDIHKHINLQSRRIQAQKLILLLEWEKDKFDKKTFIELKQNLKNILFENFARQILPKTSWIIKKHWHKDERYLNDNSMLNKKVLEPREYIWIDPLAYSDLDSPSIVTALTPPKYIQPEHTHENNYEITFYTWRSIAKYRDNWEIIELEANFWDFVIFPPNTIHTIYNPWDEPLMNISIKLPSALLDRWKNIDNRSWIWEIKKMQNTNTQWVYKTTFKKEGVPYFIKTFNFSEIKDWKIRLESDENKACFYIIKWDFIWKLNSGWKIKTLSWWDTIILDKNNYFEIEDLNWDGAIYSVFLN